MATGDADAPSSNALAVGAILASLMPALVRSGALPREAALEVFDAAIAELMPVTSMASVPGAIAIVEELRGRIEAAEPVAHGYLGI